MLSCHLLLPICNAVNRPCYETCHTAYMVLMLVVVSWLASSQHSRSTATDDSQQWITQHALPGCSIPCGVAYSLHPRLPAGDDSQQWTAQALPDCPVLSCQLLLPICDAVNRPCYETCHALSMAVMLVLILWLACSVHSRSTATDDSKQWTTLQALPGCSIPCGTSYSPDPDCQQQMTASSGQHRHRQTALC